MTGNKRQLKTNNQQVHYRHDGGLKICFFMFHCFRLRYVMRFGSAVSGSALRPDLVYTRYNFLLVVPCLAQPARQKIGRFLQQL